MTQEKYRFKYCFPMNCVAFKYCNKWNDIPKYYDKEIKDLKNTIYCEYKESYHNYLDSEDWNIVRNIVLTRAKFKCEKCKNKEHLDVHHLSYKSVFNEKLNHLVILCRDCHSEQHKH